MSLALSWCTGRWGVCGFFKYFSGFEFFLLPSIVHALCWLLTHPSGFFDYTQTFSLRTITNKKLEIIGDNFNELDVGTCLHHFFA